MKYDNKIINVPKQEFLNSMNVYFENVPFWLMLRVSFM